MTRYAAFLRAVNVAGHARVKMGDVRETFAAAGCRGVRTYIQSGNVLFDSPASELKVLEKRIAVRLGDLLGEEPKFLFRQVGDLERLLRRAPFKDLEGEPGIKLYVVFLFEKPRRKSPLPLSSPGEGLEAVGMTDREVFVVSRRTKNGFFGFPNDFVERSLGVSATSRNWSTLTRIVELARREGA